MDEILVLGGTGTIGRRVAALLGPRARVASRRGPVTFDWADPGTWEPAVGPARAVFVLAPDGVAVPAEFVRCAVDAKVERIVLLSSRAIDVMGDTRLLDAEDVVRGSGVPFTIVRADWLDQNFDEGFLRDAVGAGVVTVPLGDVRQAFVDAGDVAAVAVAALTGEGHAGQTYEVSGPRALSFGEAVGLISDTLVYRGGDADYRAAMTSFGVPAEQVEAELRAFGALRASGDGSVTDVVRRVVGRPARDFADYAASAFHGQQGA